MDRLIQLYLHDMTEFIGHDGLCEYDLLHRFWQRPAASYWRRFFDLFEVKTSHRKVDGRRWLAFEFES